MYANSETARSVKILVAVSHERLGQTRSYIQSCPTDIFIELPTTNKLFTCINVIIHVSSITYCFLCALCSISYNVLYSLPLCCDTLCND